MRQLAAKYTPSATAIRLAPVSCMDAARCTPSLAASASRTQTMTDTSQNGSVSLRRSGRPLRSQAQRLST